MTSTRQVTLLDTWTTLKDNSSYMSTVSGRGGRGRGQSSNSARSRGQSSSARGRGQQATGAGGGRGRGRGGRGRGKKLGRSVNSSYYEDEEDDICQQAMGQFELSTSEIAKTFESANESKDLPGFDTTAGGIWIYPTNRSVRDYQFQMVQTALFNNTMVSLPTGLGKTFIAAVVMYNFQRWYPNDLIIFMAPTRPLVTQQLDACHNIVGIHPSKTVELTGQTSPKKREELWKTKSVFFLTPQVMTSDLTRGSCPAEKVRCVVVDEAHKALGNHAFAQVISMLSEKKALFRVLALSATPGSDLAAVQQVFKNLLISRVEMRNESSPDILPYIHEKNVQKVVVTLDGYLKSVYDNLIEVYQTYTGKLMTKNVLHGPDGSAFSVMQLINAREVFREKMAPKFPNYQKGYIELEFNVCISLAHSLLRLLNHGLRSFYSFLQGVFNKEKGNPAVTSELKKNTNLQEVLTDVQQKLNISVANSTFNMSSTSLFTSFSKSANTSVSMTEEEDTTNPPDYLLSHPKMKVVKDIIVAHFKSFETKNETTRVMIFSELRDSVQEIGNLLNTLGPLVKPMVFIGQANKGLKQKDQVQVVQQFRDGGFNVLVATSVGEEGLDIGEVDLIMCFDAKQSPTRLVQRMGRTGRQRKGKIIFLLTKGKEENSYAASIRLQNSISKNIIDPKKLDPYLYKFSPRMVPLGIDPQCFKMSIVLTSEQNNEERDDTDVILIEDDDDDVAEEKPVQKATKTVGKQKKTSAEAKVKKPGKSKAGGSTKSAAVGKGTGRTIKQCFDDQQNPKQSEKSKPGNADVQIINVEDGNNADQSLIIEDNGFLYGMGVDQGDNDILFQIFDVELNAAATSTVKACLDIPKLPKPIKWRSEFNSVDDDCIIIKDLDLDCLKEKLDSYTLVSSNRDRCRCGNINTDDFLDAETLPCEDDDDVWTVASMVDCCNGKNTTTNNFIAASTSKKISKQEIGMDEGFVFDENDPFFDEEWEGENDDNKSDQFNTVAIDEKAAKMDLIAEDFSPIPILDDSFEELPFDQIENGNAIKTTDDNDSTTDFEEFDSPVRKLQSPKVSIRESPSAANNKNISKFKFKLNSSKKATTSKPFPVIEIKDHNDGDGDDSSTTSNDEFYSPKKKVKYQEAEKVVEIKPESQSRSQINRDLYKDDFLLFESDDEFEQEVLLKMDSGSTKYAKNNVSKDLFEDMDSPTVRTSTLINELDITNRHGMCTPPPPDSPKSVASELLSPDLSQFRFKRIRLDDQNELSDPCSQMVDPNNRSAELLNEYMDELRKKSQSSNKLSAVIVEDNNKTPTPVHICNESPNVPNSSKKKFRFKKRSIPDAEVRTTTNQSTYLVNSPKAIFTLHRPSIQVQSPKVNVTQSKVLTQLNQNSNSKSIRNQSPLSSRNSQTTTTARHRPSIPTNSILKQRSSNEIKKTSFKIPLVPRGPTPILLVDDDDDFVAPAKPGRTTTPKSNLKSSSSFRHSVVVDSPLLFDSSILTQEPNLTSSPIPSPTQRSSSSVERNPQRRRKKRRLNANPFIDVEADVDDDDSSSSVDEEDEFDGLDDELDDSFVDNESEEEGISDTQHVRYVRSVIDMEPIPMRRVERPLSPIIDSQILDVEDIDYESDSFCVINDDVEFQDVGVFTQAMNVAREEIMKESPRSARKRVTRRQAMVAAVARANAASPSFNSNPNSTKRRRRIIVQNDSSDEG